MKSSQQALCLAAFLYGADAVKLSESAERSGFPGITFTPGKFQGLAQAELQKLDYTDFDYTGKRGWQYAEDPKFVDEKEWEADVPEGFGWVMSLAQQNHHKNQEHHHHHAKKHHQKKHHQHHAKKHMQQASQPGMTSLTQHSKHSNWYRGNSIPNNSAWTNEHQDNSNEEQYQTDAPKDYPVAFSERKHHSMKKHHNSGHHNQKLSSKAHGHHQSHHQSKHRKEDAWKQEIEKIDPMAFKHQAQPSQPMKPLYNFIYPTNTHSIVVDNPQLDHAWTTEQYGEFDEPLYKIGTPDLDLD